MCIYIHTIYEEEKKTIYTAEQVLPISFKACNRDVKVDMRDIYLISHIGNHFSSASLAHVCNIYIYIWKTNESYITLYIDAYTRLYVPRSDYINTHLESETTENVNRCAKVKPPCCSLYSHVRVYTCTHSVPTAITSRPRFLSRRFIFAILYHLSFWLLSRAHVSLLSRCWWIAFIQKQRSKHHDVYKYISVWLSRVLSKLIFFFQFNII